ncbi:MAG: major capsid protein [Treponema sp.]|jgi:hypothetical protein|nr:major capsid protein [Treponema sp.]
MAIDLTRVKDGLTPDVWNKYFDEYTAELSDFRQSGILESLPDLKIPGEGVTVNMPFWEDISGDDEVWSSGHETHPDKIAAKKEVAAILTRMKSYGAEDLVKLFTGSDPIQSIIRKFARYWVRRDQVTLLSIMKGIFGSALQDNLLDESGTPISDTMMVDAFGVLGDASKKFGAVVMHSAVRDDLFKKQLISVKPTEPGTNAKQEFERFLGRRVIVDDGTPFEVAGTAPNEYKIYTTYLFGTGSIGYAEGTPENAVEFVREGFKSQTSIINRRQLIMHPRGLAWVGKAVKDTPSNDELATAANWERVFELKNIPLGALKHRIG